jgi:Ni/Fe-hydrogenase subunit HybB-like protein
MEVSVPLRRSRDRSRARPSTLTEAAMAPVVGSGRVSTALLVVLALPMAAAVAAFAYQQGARLSVTGLDDQVFWGVYEVDLVTFIGFSYGGALVSAILRLTNAHWRGPIVRLAEGTAVVTLLIGALFPIIPPRPSRAHLADVHRPQLQSPLVWDMVAILTYVLATLLLFVLPLIPDTAKLADHPGLGRFRSRLYRVMSIGWRGSPRQRAALERALTILAISVIPIAIMVHTVLSYAFSLTSRPGWHSTIFGPYFVVGAIYSGVAIVIIAAAAYRSAYGLQAWISERSIRYLAYLMVALGALYAYFFFSEITTEGYVGAEHAQALLHATLLGRFAPLTWGFVARRARDPGPDRRRAPDTDGPGAHHRRGHGRRRHVAQAVPDRGLAAAAPPDRRRGRGLSPVAGRVDDHGRGARGDPVPAHRPVPAGPRALHPRGRGARRDRRPTVAGAGARDGRRGGRSMRRLTVLLVAVTVLTVWVAGTAASASEDQQATALAVAVEAPTKEGLDHRLGVTLTTSDGAPVSGARISAYAVVELLGDRQALLGSGVTDATGVARIPVVPRHAEYRVFARFAGAGEHAPSTIEQTVVFPDEAVRAYDHEHGTHALLDPVRGFMPGAISLAVVLLWLGLAALAVVTVHTIRTASDVPRNDRTDERDTVMTRLKHWRLLAALAALGVLLTACSDAAPPTSRRRRPPRTPPRRPRPRRPRAGRRAHRHG